jgi:Spy/CpxP family protein refolding chaperone
MTALDRTRLKVWLVLIGVFVLGSLTGAALVGVYYVRHFDGRHEGRNRSDAFLEKMRGDLNLNDEQTAQIKAIVDDTRNQFQDLRAEARPRFNAIKQKERERIRNILTPVQQQRFDQITARQDAQREQRDRDER